MTRTYEICLRTNIFIGNIDIILVTKLDCFITKFNPINDMKSVKKISSCNSLNGVEVAIF